MIAEAGLVAVMLGAAPVVEAETSCAVFYPDDLIERIECAVYSNPEAYSDCIFGREVEVELVRSGDIVMIARTDCRRTRIFAALEEGERRNCSASVQPEPDVFGEPAWQGVLTRERQEIFHVEAFDSQQFRFRINCES